MNCHNKNSIDIGNIVATIDDSSQMFLFATNFDFMWNDESWDNQYQNRENNLLILLLLENNNDHIYLVRA